MSIFIQKNKEVNINSGVSFAWQLQFCGYPEKRKKKKKIVTALQRRLFSLAKI